MKRATFVLLMIKSCIALLRVLLICIIIYLKSVLRYKFVIMVTADILCLREQGCEIPWLFFEAKILGNIGADNIARLVD
jgi:hypothetical protein